MGMSIDIDKSIKELSKWRKDLNYDNGDYCYGDDTTKHSLDVAINTMRKYQKIKQIAFPLQFCSTDTLNHEAIMKICEVLEDGNVD